MFNNIRINHMKAAVKKLKEENMNLKNVIKRTEEERENLDKAQLENEELKFKLNTLINKLSDELKETEKSRRKYEAERHKFIALNAKYKKDMKNFLEQLIIKKEGDG